MTDNSHFYCIILAGGAGRRFWPISRRSQPKQFSVMRGTNLSYLQHAWFKASVVVPRKNIIVVTIEEYAQMVREHLPDLLEENLFCEPYIRDTAPSVVYATYKLFLRDPDATCIIAPSDHRISDDEFIEGCMTRALELAATHDYLLTLGTPPTRPDTNFGYIQVSGGRPDPSSTEPLKVKTFTEKPDAALAQVFVDSGEFLWNAGVFIWNLRTVRAELEEHLPLLTSQFEGWESALETPAEKDFLARVYGGCEKTSISYGLLEKTARAWVLPATFGWTDIGEWTNYYDAAPDKDADGNVLRAPHVVSEHNRNTLVLNKGADRLIAVEGLDGYIVVVTDDVVVVCRRDAATNDSLVSRLSGPETERFQ